MTIRERPAVVLMCHAESRMNREGLARWLASFCDLVGMVIIEETHNHLRARIRRELKRVGPLRLLDVFAFRLYYRALFAKADDAWVQQQIDDLIRRYPEPPSTVQVLRTADPNSAEVEEFLTKLAPDFMIARCKRILQPRIFSRPANGTFVLHPGVCPEYRNSHGVFWALAHGELDKVGLTLLQADKGVDTGPVYGYFSCPFDPARDSHLVITMRLVLHNLDALREALLRVHTGHAQPIDTTGRRSGTHGQPWFTSYLGWRTRARLAPRSLDRVKAQP